MVALITASCASPAPLPAPAATRPGPIVALKSKVTARNAPTVTTPGERVYAIAKPAVVKIVVRKEGSPFAYGAGFFISADGTLVTNHHLVKDAIRENGLPLEFHLVDGKTIVKRYAVGACGDERSIDLCILRLDHKPKRWLDTTSPAVAHTGENAYVIGHPEGFEYSFSSGVVSAVRELEFGVKHLQFTASISQGNSGGPVLDERGRLLGIATKFSSEGQNLNFAIATPEIHSLRKRSLKFKSLSTYLKDQTESLLTELEQRPMRTWSPPTDPTEPSGATTPLRLGDPITSTFPVSGDVVLLPTPNGLFESCSSTEDAFARLTTTCRDLRTQSSLEVLSRPLATTSILAQQGQLPEAPKIHDLGPGGPRTVGASRPLPWMCRDARVFPSTSLAGHGTGACFAMIRNADRPGSFRLLAEVESLGRVYVFRFASAEARLTAYAQAWMQFAVSHAISTTLREMPHPGRGPASLARPPMPFAIQLPSRFREFEFLPARRELGIFKATSQQPPMLITVVPRQPGVPMMERHAFREWMFNEVTREIQPRSRDAVMNDTGEGVETQIDRPSAIVKDLENEPGFIIAGRGQGTARNRAVFRGVIHVMGTTYIVSASARWSERSQASVEFTRLLRTIKPQL
ncbi:MAG: serine protease [Bdellovibrionaceae bacterium]|nr:serine protease [Pseudobdellovibrionaceae bacterium]